MKSHAPPAAFAFHPDIGETQIPFEFFVLVTAHGYRLAGDHCGVAVNSYPDVVVAVMIDLELAGVDVGVTQTISQFHFRDFCRAQIAACRASCPLRIPQLPPSAKLLGIPRELRRDCDAHR